MLNQQPNTISVVSPSQPRHKQRKMSIRERLKHFATENYLPWTMFKPWELPMWLIYSSVACYIAAMFFVSFLHFSYSVPWYYVLSGTLSVLVFFGYGRVFSRVFSLSKVRYANLFEKKIFFVAFLLRLAWMLLIYYIFMETYGNPFGFENADAIFYDSLGLDVSEWLSDSFSRYLVQIRWVLDQKIDVADVGYASYVGLIYYLSDNSIIALRLLKCVWSSLTVVLIYRLTRRNFGSQVARVAAIFCALWPNFWYYCGCHLKETEMVFLAVLFVEQADQMLRSRQFTAWKLIPLLLIIGALFTIRTPLALVAILALLVTIVISSSRVVSWGKRFAVGVFTGVLVVITMGNRIQENARELIEQVQSGQQKANMEWRAKRTDGGGLQQSFAKYAGAAVFAPMIFTIPFPSMVRPFDGQDVQQLLNGGNYIKNILSFFTILSMFIMLFSGSWREHMLPLAFLLGYLVVLVMSVFAQSERFHQPAMPFEMMFAAYGLSIVMSNKMYQRWFAYWCVIMVVACIAWNWFKLAGRGLA